MSEIENRTIEIGLLDPHPANYNQHPAKQVERLRVSLRKFGQPRSIVVQAQASGRFVIVAGHGVTLAARAEKWTGLRCDVIPADWPAERVSAYLAADNELGRLAEPDNVALASILEEAKRFDPELLTAIGYDEAEFDALLAGFQTPGADEWAVGLNGLPTEDRAPFQQMTFTLHDTQAEQVRAAMAAAGKLGDFTDSPNQNSNGNALAFICETFMTEHGQS